MKRRKGQQTIQQKYSSTDLIFSHSDLLPEKFHHLSPAEYGDDQAFNTGTLERNQRLNCRYNLNWEGLELANRKTRGMHCGLDRLMASYSSGSVRRGGLGLHNASEVLADCKEARIWLEWSRKKVHGGWSQAIEMKEKQTRGGKVCYAHTWSLQFSS